MLSKKENRDEQVILRDLYRDKEFLRYGMLISFCPKMIFPKKKQIFFKFPTGRSSCVLKKTRRSNAFLRRASSSLQKGWKWSNFSRYIQTFSQIFIEFFIVSNLQVWFLEKPKADVCWGRGEGDTEDVDDGGHTNQNEEGPGQDCLFHYQAEHMKFFICTLKSHTHTTQVFNHNDYLPVLKLESRVSINNFWAR